MVCGRIDAAYMIFVVVYIELWCRMFLDGLPSKTPSIPLWQREARRDCSRMSDAIAHRGPDDAKMWTDVQVGAISANRRVVAVCKR
jgi:hypothetical protein